MDRSNAGRLPAALAGPGWRPAPRTVAPQELEGSGTLSRVPPASEITFSHAQSLARRRAPPLDPARGFPRSTAAKAFVGFRAGCGRRRRLGVRQAFSLQRSRSMRALLAALVVFAVLLGACEATGAEQLKPKRHGSANAAVQTAAPKQMVPGRVRGPIPLPGRTRPSAPRTLSQISARGVFPDRARPGRR